LPIEGRLQIDLYPLSGRTHRVNIESSRPLQAAQVFAGKSPQAVLAQLPLLFSVCGIAQAAAGAMAFRQALALAATTPAEAARALLIHMETAREHLWRILIDWPALLDEPADARQAAPLQPMLQALRQALFENGDAFSLQAEPRVERDALQRQIDRLDALLEDRVFGCPAAQWLRLADRVELEDWCGRTETMAARFLQYVSRQGWQGLGAVSGGFLPELPEAELNRHLGSVDADRFVAQPLWQDRTCETTPLARQQDCAMIGSLSGEFGNGLLTRLAARLVELARIPAAMRTLAAQMESYYPVQESRALPAGTGIGQVEAARGRLVHRVELEDGQVRRYQILAPTEWNFHPAGVVARALESLPYTDEDALRRQAALLINAVDPCVGYELRVH